MRVLALAALAVALFSGTARAADVAGIVRDVNGAPVADAVLYAVPRSARLAPLPANVPPVAIDQVNAQFPFVTPLQRGSSEIGRAHV